MTNLAAWSFVAPKRSRLAICIVAPLMLNACGTYVPQIQEAWEGPDIKGDMEFRIKSKIFCELVSSLKALRKGLTDDYGRPLLPDSYGVQMEVDLSAEESTALSPNAAFTQTFASGQQSNVLIGRNVGVSAGVSLSSTATRTDTSYSYYNIGRISAEGKNSSFCNIPISRSGISPLLISDLGIKDFLFGAVVGNNVLHSSVVPKNAKKPATEAKLDIFSYDIKFVIVSNGNINPGFKLVSVTGNTGSAPLFAAGRNRTHHLVLTFGPGEQAPSEASLQTHFNTQIVQSLDRIRTVVAP